MYVIGVDIGTGSTKAVAIEPSGTVLATAQTPYPIISTGAGVSEQNPEVIWSAFITSIHRVTTQLASSPAAICLSSAMHSVIPVDEKGKPLMNMITWADNRSASIANTLKQSPAGKTVYEKTGTPIHPMSPLSKIIWLRQTHPQLFAETHKFISIKEFIWYQLFEQFEIDHSIASATGLFDITDLEWHTPALSLAGIRHDHLSAPISTTTTRSGISKLIAKDLNVHAAVPFLVGASDGCMANLGSFATQPGIAALTIGTSGAIRVAGTTPIVNVDTMPFNYRLDEDTLISGGPINNGGVALKWYAESLLQRSLRSADDYFTLLETLDDTNAGCDGLIFLPYILGERAPIWNSESCGVFFGISVQHKQNHFTRAVIEGITMSLYQIFRTLEAGGIDIKQIHVSGGFVRSELWVQILANIFGKKVCLVNADDASAIGAAYMGMKTLGIIERYPQVDPKTVVTFLPDEEEHQHYKEEIFPRFEHLYKALVLDMAVLHDHKTSALQNEMNTNH